MFCLWNFFIIYFNVDQKVELDYKDPIIGDKDFEKLKEMIMNK